MSGNSHDFENIGSYSFQSRYAPAVELKLLLTVGLGRETVRTYEVMVNYKPS